MTHLHCEEQIIGKNLWENAALEKKLIMLMRVKMASQLVIHGKPMKGSEEITNILSGKFL